MMSMRSWKRKIDTTRQYQALSVISFSQVLDAEATSNPKRATFIAKIKTKKYGTTCVKK